MSETATKKKTLAQKLLDIQADVDRLKKDGHNKFHNYDYVTEANVVDAVRNLFVTHGVMVVPSVEHSWQETRTIQTDKGEKHDTHSHVKMKYTLIDTASGETMEVFWMGEGQDSLDKGYYKAYTGSQKYFIMKTFMIPTGDDPESDNGHGAEPNPGKPNPPTGNAASNKQMGSIKGLIESIPIPISDYDAEKEFYKVKHLNELTSSQASTWIEALINQGMARARVLAYDLGYDENDLAKVATVMELDLEKPSPKGLINTLKELHKQIDAKEGN